MCKNCSECQNKNKKQFVYTTYSELVFFMYCSRNSMNNLLSYCGLVDARIRASDKDLPVIQRKKKMLLQLFLLQLRLPTMPKKDQIKGNAKENWEQELDLILKDLNLQVKLRVFVEAGHLKRVQRYILIFFSLSKIK